MAEALRTDAGFAPTLRAFVRRCRDAGYGDMVLRWVLPDDGPACITGTLAEAMACPAHRDPGVDRLPRDLRGALAEVRTACAERP